MAYSYMYSRIVSSPKAEDLWPRRVFTRKRAAAQKENLSAQREGRSRRLD